MKKILLETAFNSYFHNKYTFDSFCNLNVNSHYEEIFYSKNTYSPSKELKNYQKFLNHFIFDFLNINEEVVFSYRKDTNIVDALRPHSSKKYFFTSDIESFFTNIDLNLVKKIVLKNKKEFLIVEQDVEKYIELIVKLSTYKNNLPIGAPSSPKISNAYLLEFDNIIVDYCKTNNISYTRYSDDFIFSSNDQNALLNTELKLNSVLKELYNDKMKININKNKIYKQGIKITILGLVITPQGTITVNKKLKNNIETLLHLYISDKESFIDFFAKKYNSDIEKVSGSLSYIYSIDINYINKLKRKYGNFLVNSFIHRNINNE